MDTVRQWLKRTDAFLLNEQSRVQLVELLIEKRAWDDAMELIRDAGAEGVDPGKLVSLLTHFIEEKGNEEDELLLSLSFYVFRQRKYNDTVLEYLCRYLNAPSEDMADLYTAARRFGAQTADLSERLLIQMLYCARLVPEAYQIFQDYREAGGREYVIRAYLNYTADAYFVRGVPAEAELLDLLRRRDERGESGAEVASLAVLLYYSREPEAAAAHLGHVERILRDMLRRGYEFPFYLSLPRSLVEKYLLYDKTFLEFRTDPDKQVYVHFCLPESPYEFERQEMRHMYGGIFVTQFVLFFGEKIQYYITEEDDEMQKVAGSGELGRSDMVGAPEENRFDRLNTMLLQAALKEEEPLVRGLKDFAAKDRGVRVAFPIL